MFQRFANLRDLMCLAGFTLMVVSPSQSEDGQARCLRSIQKSRCGPGDPAIGLQRERLIGWFHKLELRLKAQPNYDGISNEYANNKNTFAIMTCHFRVADDGAILDPKISVSSTVPSLDKRYLSLVVDAGPLEPPNNALPQALGVDLTLVKVELPNGKKLAGLVRELGQITELDDEAFQKLELYSREEEQKLSKSSISQPKF